jgi:hypothetical protein
MAGQTQDLRDTGSQRMALTNRCAGIACVASSGICRVRNISRRILASIGQKRDRYRDAGLVGHDRANRQMTCHQRSLHRTCSISVGEEMMKVPLLVLTSNLSSAVTHEV